MQGVWGYVLLLDKSWTLEEEDYMTCWGAACCCCSCKVRGLVDWRLYMIIMLFVVNLVVLADEIHMIYNTTNLPYFGVKLSCVCLMFA